MAKELTTITLEKLKPGPARREIPDCRVGGLYFIVQPSGKRSWAYRYRLAGKPRKYTIGAYPAIALTTARERAGEARDKVAEGVDPGAEKKASRAAALVPANDLVEAVVKQFVSHYAKRHLKASTAHDVERILVREVVAPWRRRRLSAVGRADIHALLDDIVTRGSPVSANRALSWLRRMCGWAVERGLIEANPCTGIKAPAAETARDRVKAGYRAGFYEPKRGESFLDGRTNLSIPSGAAETQERMCHEHICSFPPCRARPWTCEFPIHPPFVQVFPTPISMQDCLCCQTS
jgi:hypothetical protein